MEEHMQYLMWFKSKHILKSHFQSSVNSFNNSWEEQAFAEDAAGPLGGFVWPPRSYSCTFCRREFRSAQALGGHMNVHRRDRARLKQSHSPQTELHFEKPIDKSPSTLTATQHSPQGGDSGSPSGSGFASSPFSSAARASAILSQESSSVKSHVSPFSSFITKEQQRRSGYSSSPQGSDSNPLRLVSISNTKTAGGKFGRKEELVTVMNGENTVETNLSVGIKFCDSHNLQRGSDNDETIKSKRRKSIAMASSPFFNKPCSSDRFVFQSEGLRIKTSSIEEIDLELRLGDPPEVK